MRRLNNITISSCVAEVEKKSEELQELVYAQYKNAYKLSQSNNFRGISATACKDYITNITINNLNGVLNVIAEMGDTLTDVKNLFLEYESAETGIVDTEILEDVIENVDTIYKAAYVSYISGVNSTLNAAAAYITLTPLSEAAVEGAYSSLTSKIEEINDNLLVYDSKGRQKLEMLLSHMESLEKMIDGINQIIDAEGHIDYANVSSVLNAETFYIEDSENLAKMMEEDPFSYCADGGSGWEQQWAAGALQDVYIFGGLNAWTGEYVVSTENGKNSAEASGDFFSGEAGAQFTDFARWTADATLVHGEGKAFIGDEFFDGYFGIGAEGKASLFEADMEAKVGSEDFYGYADAGVSLFSASGYAKVEFTDEHNYVVGLGGRADGASAKATMGLSFLEVSEKDSVTGQKESLFKLSATPEATLGAGADFLVESKTVIDGDAIDVNTCHVKLGGKLGLGLKVDITVPYISFDF